MTIQPKLTNFPASVFATSKRRLQARIREQRQVALNRSLGGYSCLFESVIPAGWLAQIDPTQRQRTMGAIPIFWAWIAQLFEQNGSCSKALTMLQSWYQELGLPVPSGGTSGYCQARRRLSVSFISQIQTKIYDHLTARIRERDRWRGLRLKAIDGSSVQLMDTPENQAEYAQPSTQKPGCGFPVMGITGLLDLSSGAWQAIAPSNFRQHDSKAAFGVIDHLGAGELLLADRAYCGYALMASVLRKGCHVAFRLNGARHRKLDWRRGKRVSSIARIVTWERGQYQQGSSISRKAWEALPETLTLRLIKMKFSDRMGELRNLVVATTLLDSERYPDEEVFQLYARRWEIEVRLRDVKTTMGLESLKVRTPAMARKTLLIATIAYNLIRSVMQHTAAEADCDLEETSFKATLDSITATRGQFRQAFSSPTKRRKVWDFLIRLSVEKRLNLRPYRHEPRATKRRPKPYAYLTDFRSVFREIPHREHHRKPA